MLLGELADLERAHSVSLGACSCQRKGWLLMVRRFLGAGHQWPQWGGRVQACGAWQRRHLPWPMADGMGEAMRRRKDACMEGVLTYTIV